MKLFRSLGYGLLVALLISTMLPALLVPAPAIAQGVGPRPTALEAFRNLQAHTSTPLAVRWARGLGVAEFLAPRDAGFLPYTPPSVLAGDGVAIAHDFLRQNLALFGLRAVDELRLLRVEPDHQLGWQHIRLEQVYRGLAVFGRQLVVHLDQQQRVVAVNGHFAPGLDLPVETTLDARAAEQVALDHLLTVELNVLERAKVQHEVMQNRTRSMIYVDYSGKAHLSWYVTVLTSAPLGQWRVFVHGRRPIVIHAFNELAEAKRRITFSAENTSELPGRRVIDEGERSRDDVAQAAHDGAGVVYDYFLNNFKRDGIDGKGSPIVSTVHYGSSPEEAENAAWIGELQQMIYGDGGRIFRPLPYGLDVVAHELTHGVTDNTAQLIYEAQSGALNESYSDIFAALIDDDNWTIGEQVVKSPPFPTKVLRSLEDPNLGVYDPNDPLGGIGQPATADQYANLPVSRRADNGGVHINSGIPNYAAYLVGTALGRDKMGQIYYRTLTEYLTPSSDFYDHAAATVRAAQDLYGAADAQTVRGIFTQIGIDPGGSENLPPPTTDDGSTLPNIPSQPDQPEQVPQGCRDIIVNGGFENDKDGWVQVTAGDFSLIDPELPFRGKRSAWLGGTDKENVQLLYQELRLPPNASTVGLRYTRLIHEEASGLGAVLSGDATFGTLVADGRGKVLGVIEELASSQGDDTWHTVEFNLSQLAGKTIRLGFASELVLGNVSSFFIDEVALIVCTAGGAPAPPATGDANTVFIEGTIVDSNTGAGISGAQFFVLRPGLSASQAGADGQISADEVLTYGVSDAKGFYRTKVGVPRGQNYSAVVIAGGYRPIVADGEVKVPKDAQRAVVIDATMRRGR